MVGGGGRRRMSIERALAVGDLHQRLVERGRRLAARPDGAFAAEVGHHAVDRAHAPLDLAGGGAPLGDQLVEPAVELGYGIGELARRFVLAAGRRSSRWRIEPRQLVELPRQAVEALIDLGDARIGRAGRGRRWPGGREVSWCGRGLGAVVAGRRPTAAVVVRHIGAAAAAGPDPNPSSSSRTADAQARPGPARCLHALRNSMMTAIEPLARPTFRQRRAASRAVSRASGLTCTCHGTPDFMPASRFDRGGAGADGPCGTGARNKRWMVRRPVPSGRSFSGLG